MENVFVNAGDGYDVLIGRGLMDEAGDRVRDVLGTGLRLAVFADTNVAPLYADRVAGSLAAAGFEVIRHTYPAGEQSKNIGTVAEFVEFMAENGMTRKDAVVVIGGGVAGDMGGFAAATYMRGIKFVQIPTSLLAAVDSSVGGKTGVDIEAGKNLMGAFWQPSLVLCDTGAFDTLTDDLLLDGFAEVIKTAAIRDREFFDRLEAAVNERLGDPGDAGPARLDATGPARLENIANNVNGPAALRSLLEAHADSIVRDCVRIKGQVVELDEKEGGLRRILNFGHTMAHAIEKDADYGISHGKAVAIGMLMVTAASEARGISPAGTYDRLLRLIAGLGYRTRCDATLEVLCDIARRDKKSRGDRIGIVCLEEMGRAGVTDVKLDELAGFYGSGAALLNHKECQ